MGKHIQGSPAWLAHRQNHIGASDAPIIMGDSPWCTPYQLWEQKLGLAPGPAMNPQMQRGIDLEPVARKAFEEETGLEMFPQVIYHPEHTFMMASLDGMTLDGTESCEIKVPGKKAHDMALDGVVPPYYVPQLQHQLACNGLPRLWYWSFDDRREDGKAKISVPRDDEYIALLIEKEKEFWECVRTRTPPPFTDKDYQLRECATWSAYGARLAAINEELEALKVLENEKKAIRAELVADAGDRSCKCGGLTLSKSYTPGRIDYSAIPELQGVDLEQYRSKPSIKWVLTVKKDKDGVHG